MYLMHFIYLAMIEYREGSEVQSLVSCQMTITRVANKDVESHEMVI